MILSFVMYCLNFISGGTGVAIITLAIIVVTILAVLKVVPGNWITGTIVTGIGGWSIAILARGGLNLVFG